MKNTGHKFVAGWMATLLSLAAMCDATGEIRKPRIALPERLTGASAYGLGTVTWGAIHKERAGNPVLFVYGVRYG
ncbi:MAG: hypothetical protein ACREPE_08275, partial [Lysobacter sp.]